MSQYTKILCTHGCRYAVPGKPGLPQTILRKGVTYNAPEQVTFAQAENAIKNKWAEDQSDKRKVVDEVETKIETEYDTKIETLEGSGSKKPEGFLIKDNPESSDDEPFDLATASAGQMKEFVQSDSDMDAAIDLRQNKEDLRNSIAAYLVTL